MWANSNLSHMVNAVQLDGKWYLLDPVGGLSSWMPLPIDSYEKSFLVSSATMADEWSEPLSAFDYSGIGYSTPNDYSNKATMIASTHARSEYAAWFNQPNPPAWLRIHQTSFLFIAPSYNPLMISP